MSRFVSGDDVDAPQKNWPMPHPPTVFLPHKGSDVPIPVPIPVNPLEVLGEQCLFKSGISAVAGSVFGVLIGTFMASTAAHNISQTETAWQQFKSGFRGSLQMGRNFGWVGFIYSGTECYFEQARARSDKWNTLGAGCFSGAVLAAKGGSPQSMAMGCAGFAAFGYAIDYFTGRHDASMNVKFDSQKY